MISARGDTRKFYQALEVLVEDMGQEIWIGDAAQIRASYVRKQKTESGTQGTF